MTTPKNDWIKASEKMPKEDGRYLVVEKHQNNWVGVCAMRGGKFDCEIKYWMPLPKAPKDK